MRYRNLLASDGETPEQTSARIEMMYGVGTTLAELDILKAQELAAQVALDRARAMQAKAEALLLRARKWVRS